MPPLPTSPFVIAPTAPLVLHCVWGTEKTRSPCSASAPPPLPSSRRLPRCPRLSSCHALLQLRRPSSPRPPPFFPALAKIHPIVAAFTKIYGAPPPWPWWCSFPSSAPPPRARSLSSSFAAAGAGVVVRALPSVGVMIPRVFQDTDKLATRAAQLAKVQKLRPT